jgi:endonuclease YncB( thermonuclease family)
VDGDTLKITENGNLVTIRIIGIDTPETVDPRKPVQCFGQEASAQAKALLANQLVSLTPDPTQNDKDRYDRLLRYVTLEDGTDYGLKMIADGYAHEYTYEVPYQRQAAYKQAEQDASAAANGLWGTSTCDGDTTKAAVSPAPATTTPATTTPTATSPPVAPTAAPAATPTPSTPTTSTPSHVDKNCPDFATHAEAQAYFDSMGGSPSNNVDNLDADHDGLACESLK